MECSSWPKSAKVIFMSDHNSYLSDKSIRDIKNKVSSIPVYGPSNRYFLKKKIWELKKKKNSSYKPPF